MNKTKIYNFLIIQFLFVTVLSSFLLAQSTKFTHIATSGNISLNWTVIDHPKLNGDPNANFFTTQNWNAASAAGVYNNASIGVWYDGSNWSVFNQNLEPMPDGAKFNIYIHQGNEDFEQTSTAGNILGHQMILNNVSIDGKGEAKFQITQNWNPSGAPGVYNDAAIGVWFNGANWAVFNQNFADMPEGAGFNVLVQEDSDGFIHVADAGNIVSNWTSLDHPELNGNPNAIFFATQHWNPPGGDPTYNDSPIGVWYDGAQWAVFNQNLTDMPEGAGFNIFLAINGVTDVENPESVIIEQFELSQNYPNPFNPSTTINYSLPEQSFVTLRIYDVLGKEVASLVSEEKPAGQHDVNFDAGNLSSGLYIYKIQAGNFTASNKMVLMK